MQVDLTRRAVAEGLGAALATVAFRWLVRPETAP